MKEQAAERKVVSILFLSLGSAGRKNLTDRHQYMVISTATLAEMRENCDQTFIKKRNSTLERYKFFSRKQRTNKTLRQFWNALTGLAARCDFGNLTESLIMDAFIQNMQNRTVQERLCTEPNENPQEGGTMIRSSLRRRHQPAEELHRRKRRKKRTNVRNLQPREKSLHAMCDRICTKSSNDMQSQKREV